MKYMIIGAGGTGGCIGGYLANAGCDVTFIARGRHLKAMREHGLRVESARIGDVTIYPVKACTMEEYCDTPDVVFVCVKYYALSDVTDFLNRVATAHTLVIPILNVFGTGGEIAEACPEVTALDGCIYIYSMIKEPGIIAQPGAIFKMYFGYRMGQEHRLESVVRRVEEDLNQAQIDAYYTDNILKEALQKFSFVSPMGGAELYFNAKGGAFKEKGEKQDFFFGLVNEVEKLANAMGITFDESLTSVNLAILKRLDDDSDTSMVRDVARGGSSEIDGLIHRIVRLSQKYHVGVPHYQAVSDWATEHNIQ